ncbi:MAG: DnaJ domain-containing protein, partial [Roseburia sp.]|nr:DnaJ domain-containing protein [Roseburia sp.]
MKNYYRILNVTPTATEDVIKRNYRSLAKRYHPDVNPDDKLAADKFSDINEAYDTLSDPTLRSKYDAALKQEAEKKTARPSAQTAATGRQAQTTASARQAQATAARQ